MKDRSTMFSAPYEYFLAVANASSFRKAAEKLFVSQPAISRQIRLLEERLGYPLFHRTTRHVGLSPEGKVLYETLLECDMSLQKSKQVIDTIHREGGLSGHLRIGVHSGWSVNLFHLPCFNDFAERNPSVQQSFICDGFLSLADMLRENKLDLIVTNEDTAKFDFNIRSVHFGIYHYKLVILADHPQVRENRDDMLANLHGLDCYTHSSSLQTAEERKHFLLDAVGTNTNIEVVPNMDSVLTAIENKQGFTIMLGCSRMCYLPYVRTFDLDKSTTLVIAYKQDESDDIVSAFISNLFRMQMEQQLIGQP